MSSPHRTGPVATNPVPLDGEPVYEADAKAIGDRIRRAREDALITNASRFARLIGVAPHSVYRYERGDHVPESVVLVRIAEITGRSMEWLMKGRSDAAGGALRAWLATPTGQGATADELAWIERVDLEGMDPSGPFFDLLLSARRHGLTANQAVRAAAAQHAEKITRRKR